MSSSTRLHAAAELLRAYDRAVIANLFHGAPEPNPEDYGYCHGWICHNGRMYSRDELLGPSVTYDF